MPHIHQYDLKTRVAIVVLRSEGYGWTAISEKLLNCTPNGVQSYCIRVFERAGVDPFTNPGLLPPLSILLEHVEDVSNRGREERFPEGSYVANRLVTLATLDEEHEDMSHMEIIQAVEHEVRERIPYTTGKKVLEAEEVVKRVPPRKIRLDAAHREARLLFAEWAIGKLHIATFIFTDETSVESFHHRKQGKISMQKGGNPFEHSRPPIRTFEYVMFWGAICQGYPPGPFHIWEKETEEEKRSAAITLEQTNAILEDQEAQMRQRAQQPGTNEYNILQEINANVRQQDIDNPLPSGHRRRLRRPEWEFKLEREKRDKQGGIDWYRYREQVLKPKLYPWADQIARETGRKVYIVEDNAPLHTKAKRLAARERIQYGGRVEIVDWPALSPDLNRIERCWDSLKDKFEALRAQSVERRLLRDTIKREIVQAWLEQPQSLINAECQRFRKKLQQCIENRGDNNFYG